MAGDNNALAGELPETPHPELKKLAKLIGNWKISGDEVEGELRFEWMEGGHFFIHHFDIQQGGHYKGIEYVGFDEDTQTLRSHLMGTDGANFTYTWELEGDKLTIWFGEKGSDNVSLATFARDGLSYSGKWQWPNPDGGTGGYSYVVTRVD